MPKITSLACWNPESIGIKKELEITRSSGCFNENIYFNGHRHEVQLPWKENHPTVPSENELCGNCLRSLQHKLLKESYLVKEYNQIIEDQTNMELWKEYP